MEDELFASSDGGHTTCVICFEKFTEPKLISCYHTFCRECLDNYIIKSEKKGVFPCPICRTDVKVPTNGANGFQTNFYITEQTGGAKGSADDLKKGETRRKDIDTDECIIHTGEQVTLYCIKCKTGICRDCKIEEHDGHRSERLSKKIVDLKAEAGILMSRTKTKLEKATKYEDAIKNAIRVLKNKSDRLQTAIGLRKEMMTDKVLRDSTSTSVRLGDVTNEAAEDIKEELNRVKTTMIQLGNIHDMMKTAFESNNPVYILNTIPIVRESLDVLSLSVETERLVPDISLTSMEKAEDCIPKAIGTVVFQRKPRRPLKKLLFVNSHSLSEKTKDLYIKSICPVDTMSAWLTLRSKKQRDKNSILKKVCIGEDQVFQELITLKVVGLVGGVAIFSDGAMALSVPFENRIALLENEQNDVVDFAFVKTAVGMTVFNNQLYICSVESPDYKTVQKFHSNRIVVLSRQGLVTKVIEFFDGSPLFSYPGRVSVNHNGDIWVADFKDATVVVLNSDGGRKHVFKYADEEGTMVGEVDSDRAGYVLVETSKGLHIKNNQGEDVHRYSESWLHEIVALAVGTPGYLWVGATDCAIAVWKYA